MSVDVEDYFQTEAMSKAIPRETWDDMPCRVERNTELLFELFSEYNVSATFFFLGWVAERYPQLVRKAKHLGHEIACHSYWHRPIYSLSPDEFRKDTHRAKAAIEDAAGVQVQGYRAPSFSLTPGVEWASDILAEAGFAYDSSVHPVAHDLYDNRHARRGPHQVSGRSLLEIPISTVRLGKKNFPFSGGGYFRILPYSYVRGATRRLNFVDKQPSVFYIHPWEIDPGQPKISTNWRSRFRQYTGLKDTESKLRRLCKEFKFTTMSNAFSTDTSIHPSAAYTRDKDISI